MNGIKKYLERRNITKIDKLVICIICICSILNNKVIAKDNLEYFKDVKVNGIKAAIVMEKESGRVLYQYNKDERLAMASLTKMMTSILLVESCDMDEEITVAKGAEWIGGSELGIKGGEKVSAYTLLVGMLLPSRK